MRLMPPIKTCMLVREWSRLETSILSEHCHSHTPRQAHITVLNVMHCYTHTKKNLGTLYRLITDKNPGCSWHIGEGVIKGQLEQEQPVVAAQTPQ